MLQCLYFLARATRRSHASFNMTSIHTAGI